MGGNGLFSVSMEALSKNLSFLESSHRIIANNIANADTPFYKARRAPSEEFRASLARAIESGGGGAGAMTLASSEHVREAGGALEVTPVESRGEEAGVLRHDGNNVNLEKEMTALAENALMYRVMSDLLRKQYMMLQSAIRERVD